MFKGFRKAERRENLSNTIVNLAKWLGLELYYTDTEEFLYGQGAELT
jgi:hypothetical protein